MCLPELGKTEDSTLGLFFCTGQADAPGFAYE